jgi:lipoprotein-anchoring transpeptidase ErfK/SrfK
VRERLVIPRGRLRRIYGPFAFGTSAHSNTLSGGNWGEGVIGVHGTGAPQLIPGRISHGCVRLPNAKIQRLRRLMGLGTPIRIR